MDRMAGMAPGGKPVGSQGPLDERGFPQARGHIAGYSGFQPRCPTMENPTGAPLYLLYLLLVVGVVVSLVVSVPPVRHNKTITATTNNKQHAPRQVEAEALTLSKNTLSLTLTNTLTNTLSNTLTNSLTNTLSNTLTNTFTRQAAVGGSQRAQRTSARGQAGR